MSHNMTSHSPQPVHTPDPASPFHILDAQWGIIHQYLYNLPQSGAQSASRDWLNGINRNVLLTALAKKRAEIENLWTEANQAESSSLRHSKIEINFPNYEAGTPPFTPPPSVSTMSPPSPAITLPHDRYTGSTGVGYASAEHVDRLSPLSPTFGPRRFDLFSGTVSRRRSLPPSSSRAFSNSSSADNRKGTDERKSLLKDWERRILWEAAWKEIERNLDRYVDRFAGTGDGKETVRRNNEDIWEELVDLKVEAELLEGRIRSARVTMRDQQ
ncbi:uncharacterized protein EI97DRAFT_289738 [Westerdykella ornata]|uniref:Uncharacterized protein n=1 Tax=Westerdykella ornata TaxID=318751 RepID=A0A6A6JLK6_WESOR|nr:uncharacterized protein EI97DRAFT_289738 [Westerdykella ornata]KAF2277387.1 hypothetical protein EI97DRAFT_289738 [Westerdykella ornata]